MKHIAYIHGLHQSHVSFNYLIDKLPEHHAHKVDYDSPQSLDRSIEHVLKQIPGGGQLTLVGHSLGGVIAALIAIENAGTDHIEQLVTISSPLGGSRAASTLRWLPAAPAILADICQNSQKIRLISGSKLQIPALSIISTEGSVLTTAEPNDGIVTVSSQEALPFGKKVHVKSNHFEILLSNKTVKLISDFLWDSSTK